MCRNCQLYHSVIGRALGSGFRMVYGYERVHDIVIIGRPAENIVTFLYADGIFKNGFEQ